jgi:hypothetical protein
MSVNPIRIKSLGILLACSFLNLLPVIDCRAENLPGYITLKKLSADLEAAEAAEKRILKTLETRVDVDFDNTPLRDAVKFLSDKAGVPIQFPDWLVQEEGITTEEPVTLRLRHKPVRLVLNYILSDFDLTWMIEDAKLVITVEGCPWPSELRIYNVRKLLAKVPDFYNKNVGLRFRHLSEEYVIKESDKVSRFFGGGNQITSATIEKEHWLLPALRNLTSGPWFEDEGTGGVATVVNDLLIVRQTKHVQQEVPAILQLFENFVDGKLNHKAVQLRPIGYLFEDDAEARRNLRKPISVKFDEIPLNTAINIIAEKVDVSVVIMVAALAEDGIEIDEKVTFKAEKQKAGEILTQLLEPRGCVIHIVEGVLEITTEIDSGSHSPLSYIAFDVRDLLKVGFTQSELQQHIQSETSGPWYDDEGIGGTLNIPFPGLMVIRQTQRVHAETASLLRKLRKKNASGVQIEWTRPSPDNQFVTRLFAMPDKQTANEIAQALPKLILTESWESAGGAGTIQVIGTTMAIRQTEQNQRIVEQMIDQIQKYRRYYERLYRIRADQPVEAPKPGQNIPRPGAGFFSVN